MDLSVLASMEGVEGLEPDTGGGYEACAEAGAPHIEAEIGRLREQLCAIQAAQATRQGRGRRPDAPGGAARNRNWLPRVAHLTPEQVKQYLDAHQCFGCKSTEHRWQDCPSRSASSKQGK